MKTARGKWTLWKSADRRVKWRPHLLMHASIVVSSILLLSLGLLRTPAAAETVRLATLNWAPYIGETLEYEGYAADLIRTAFRRSGYDVKFFYMPWQRAVKTVLDGSYDGLCPAYYTKKRAAEYSLSREFPAGPLVFAKRKEAAITFDRIQDLKPYTIAVVRGYANTTEFDEADYLQKSFTNSDQTGYRRLLFGSVDLWLADKFVAQSTMAAHLPERAAEIDFIEKPLGVKNLHVAFSKAKPNYKELTRAFDKGLEAILNDGTLQKVLARHGLSLE